MINNVILIYPSYERGGVKKNFLSYVKALKKNNLKIKIISDKNILRDVKSDNKIKIHIIKNFKSRLFYKYFTSLFSSYKLYQLRKINDKEKTRVISFQSSFFTSIVSSICGLKLIIRVSEDPIGATIHSDNRMSSFLVMLTKIITYNLCYKILVNSKLMKINLEKFVINKKKILLQYNMNLKKIKKYNIKRKKNIFLNLGRFCKQKNQTIILKAFSHILKKYPKKGFKLYFCGDGPDKPKLLHLVKELNLKKNVKILNWQKNTEKNLRDAKYFIFPSLYEGLPNSLIEAVNNDLVCICSNISGVNDICGKDYIKIDNKDFNDIFLKMKIAHENYYYLTRKSKLNKNKLNKFMFKNLNFKLLNNIN